MRVRVHFGTPDGRAHLRCLLFFECGDGADFLGLSLLDLGHGVVCRAEPAAVAVAVGVGVGV